MLEEQPEMVQRIAPPIGCVGDEAAERANVHLVDCAAMIAPVFQGAEGPRNCPELGLLGQELWHLASGIDAFFQLAIELQYKGVTVIDDGISLLCGLGVWLQVGVDRGPCLAKGASMSANQFARVSTDTPAAHNREQKRKVYN